MNRSLLFHYGVLIVLSIAAYTVAMIAYSRSPLETKLEDPSVTAITKSVSDHLYCGQYDDAIREVTTLFDRKTRSPALYVARGEAYLKKGFAELAITDLTEAIRLAPRSYSAALQLRALAYLQLGKHGLAISDCQEAILVHPADVRLHSIAGEALLASGDVPGAIRHLEESLRLDSNQPGKVRTLLADAYYQHAIMLADQRRGTDAQQALATARQNNPQGSFPAPVSLDVKQQYQQGQTFLANHKYSQAEKAFSEVIRLRPKDADAICQRGVALLALGLPQAAIHDFRATLEIAPDNAAALRGRGMAYFQLGEYHVTVEDLTRAMRHDPDHAETHFVRGKAYWKLDQKEKAVADIQRGRWLAPNHHDPDADTYFAAFTSSLEQLALGMENVKAGNLDQAIHQFNDALAIRPTASTFYWRGLAFLLKGFPDTAVADFDQAIALDGKLAAAYRHRGRAYLEMGRTDLAKQDCTHAIRLEPVAEAYANRGLAYFKSGNLNRAADDFQEAMRLDGNYLYPLSYWLASATDAASGGVTASLAADRAGQPRHRVSMIPLSP